MPIEAFRMTGWTADVHPSEMPPDQWSDVDDMVHRDGTYERVGGQFTQESVTPTVAWLQNAPGQDLDVADDIENYWLFGGLDTTAKVFIRQPGEAVTTEVTGSSGSVLAATGHPNDWTGGVINGFPFVNVGTSGIGGAASDMKYWPRTGTGGPPKVPDDLVAFSGQRSQYRVDWLRAHRFHLFGGHTISNANGHQAEELIWSTNAATGAVPTDWVPAASNEAGDVRLTDTPGALIDGISHAGRFWIGKQQSMYHATYVGGNAVFAFALAATGVGPLSRHCMASVGQHLYILGPDDVFVFDGRQFRSICDRRVRRQIFNAIYAANADPKVAFLAHNPARSEIWVATPENDTGTLTCDKVFVYNTETGKWGHRSMFFSGASGIGCAAFGFKYDTGLGSSDVAVQFMHLGHTESKKIVRADVGFTDPASADIAWHLERTHLDFGDPNRVKVITQVRPRMVQDATISASVSMAATDNINTVPSYTTAASGYDPATDEWIDVTGISGKYIHFKIAEQDNDDDRVYGFDVRYEWGGKW